MTRLRQTHAVDRQVTLLQWLVSHPFWMRVFIQAGKFYQKTGLQYLFRKTGVLESLGLSALDAMIRSSKRISIKKDYYPAVVTEVAKVALFTGCFTSEFDGDLINDIVVLLNRLGVSVWLPDDQQCCGALHRHHGLCEQAEKLAQRNIEAFKVIRTVGSGLYSCTPFHKFMQI